MGRALFRSPGYGLQRVRELVETCVIEWLWRWPAESTMA